MKTRTRINNLNNKLSLVEIRYIFPYCPFNLLKWLCCMTIFSQHKCLLFCFNGACQIYVQFVTKRKTTNIGNYFTVVLLACVESNRLSLESKGAVFIFSILIKYPCIIIKYQEKIIIHNAMRDGPIKNNSIKSIWIKMDTICNKTNSICNNKNLLHNNFKTLLFSC